MNPDGGTGMIYLLLAILSSAAVSLGMRLSTGRISGNNGMLAMNYLMCLLLAGGFAGIGNLFPLSPALPTTLAMGTVNGILYLLGFILLQLNVKKNGVVLSATFMKLGLLVPMVISVFLFGEIPALLQSIGFFLAVMAIVLINFEKSDSALQFKTGLVLLLLAGGGGDAMSKIFEELGDTALSPQFLFYTFLAAFLLCAVLTLWKKEQLGVAEVLFGLLVGIPNFFSARFLLLALHDLPAVIVYPTYSVATILVITLVGVVFFKERLGKRQWLALTAILAALALLNV